MNILESIKLKMESLYQELRHKIEVWYYSGKYTDYANNEFNLGHLKHVWGVKSGIDLSSSKAHFYTMNDIDVTYDRKNKLYSLGIETALIFENRKEECDYLKELLGYFTDYMKENNYSLNYNKAFFCSRPSILSVAESIEELYINFKIYVEGHCSVYNSES